MVRSALAMLIEEEGAKFQALIVRGLAEHADATRKATALQKLQAAETAK